MVKLLLYLHGLIGLIHAVVVRIVTIVTIQLSSVTQFSELCVQSIQLPHHMNSIVNWSCAQYFSSSDLRFLAIRSCLWSSDVTALVAVSRAYSIQIDGPGPLSSSGQCPRLPRTIHSAVGCSKSIDISSSTQPTSSSLDIGARAFPVSGPALSHSLSTNSIDTLSVFHRRLKNYLFCHLYPGAVQ